MKYYMYKSYQKNEAIRAIQKMLSQIYPDSNISPNGLFDAKTKTRLMDFQKAKNIEPSGIADIETTALIFAEAENKRLASSDNALSFPIRMGEASEKFGELNFTIRRLLEYYGIFFNLREEPIISKESIEGANILRKIYLLDPTPEIDSLLYNRIYFDKRSLDEIRSYDQLML